MARTPAVFSLPAALVLIAWLRLEEVAAPGADWLWIALLALLPALAPAPWLRLALVPPAALTALWVAFDTPAPDDRRGFFEPVYHRFSDGLLDYYDVTVPFSAPEQPHMHGVLLLAVFGFCTLLAQAVAARQALVAVLAVVAGAGWPAALYPSGSVAYGAIILCAALWILAGLRSTPRVPALVAGAALVLVAAAASTTSAVAKDGILDWETWDPSGALRVPVSVSYVWDANYGGIEFAEKPTTVLRIVGPERGFYWRATTLDDFDGDRWLESPVPIASGPAVGPLPADPLLPAAARNPNALVRQDVEVVALNDTHVVGAAQPVRIDAPSLGEAVLLSSGLVRAQLRRGQRYSIWSYAPRPGPAELARLDADYPAELDRFLDLGRTRVEPFGTPGRDEEVDALFEDERYLALWPYREVWEQARRLRADARTPYGAVVAIETWLRSTGGFRYDEQPPAGGAGLPPLAYFVAEGKRGYCQHFAGAMAVMLRLLGIPARVAAGFTSGKREDGGWTVTDHNAHAWVEAWFPGYGWLAFDPTPGRGSLTASYSASSSGFNAGDAADGFQRGSGATAGGGAQQLQLLERERLLAERERLAQAQRQDGGLSSLWLLLLLAAGAVAGIALAKLIRRRARYLTRDPRQIASAARHELADFLADQGIAVGASATPDELRELVRVELGRDARGFADALAEARFGPPGASREAAERVRRELRTLLRSLRRGLGRTARLRGLVALRSLRV